MTPSSTIVVTGAFVPAVKEDERLVSIRESSSASLTRILHYTRRLLDSLCFHDCFVAWRETGRYLGRCTVILSDYLPRNILSSRTTDNLLRDALRARLL